MFFNIRDVSVKLVSSSPTVATSIPSSLSFYISEPFQEIQLIDVKYRVMKQEGRNSILVRDWSATYQIPSNGTITVDAIYSNTEVSRGDNLVYEFVVTDSEGMEAYVRVPGITVIEG